VIRRQWGRGRRYRCGTQIVRVLSCRIRRGFCCRRRGIGRSSSTIERSLGCRPCLSLIDSTPRPPPASKESILRLDSIPSFSFCSNSALVKGRYRSENTLNKFEQTITFLECSPLKILFMCKQKKLCCFFSLS